MHPMLTTAVKAARRAGSLITRASRDIDLIQIQNKGPNDFVSEVDRAAEREIVDMLLTAYPNHAILAEEGTHAGKSANSEFCWIIDPLDGTTNFLHGMPHYCTSIALEHNGVLEQAVIYDPVRNDLFIASKGGGAFLNDKRIRVTKRPGLNEALLATGFPFKETDRFDLYLEMLRSMTGKTAGLRRAGSAALDLAYVAAGWYDGYWEMGLKPWDMAAGALLIQEAGGIIADFSGDDTWMDTGDVLAGTPKVFAQMAATFAPLMLPASKGTFSET